MHIYELPELKPGLRAGNIGWLREPTLFTKKLKGLGIQRIVIQPPLELYQDAVQRLGLSVIGRTGQRLETGDLVLYETDHAAGLAALAADFDVSLGPLGIIHTKGSDAIDADRASQTQSPT
uniref:Uncharacterized protein n=1 Tax=viral metagenome TaxID=1070528 RepID=A0A6C0DR80_9ZZZZ